jgi:hypothetical protein
VREVGLPLLWLALCLLPLDIALRRLFLRRDAFAMPARRPRPAAAPAAEDAAMARLQAARRRARRPAAVPAPTPPPEAAPPSPAEAAPPSLAPEDDSVSSLLASKRRRRG